MTTQFEIGPTSISIKNERIFEDATQLSLKRLAKRLFLVPEIEAVDFEADSNHIRISFPKVTKRDKTAFLSSLADVIGDPSSPEIAESLLPYWPKKESVTLKRWGGIVSTLDVAHKKPGRLHVRSDRFRHVSKSSLLILESKLFGLKGVRSISFSTRKTSLVVHHDTETSIINVVRLIESFVSLESPKYPRKMAYAPVRFSAANVNFLLSAGAQFMYPVAIPIASTVLVLTRLDHFKKVGKELFKGKVGAPAFQTVVLACSVAHASPFASALAEWLGCVWQRRLRRSIAHETSGLLDQLQTNHSAVGVLPNAQRVTSLMSAESPVDSTYWVEEGESIPTDGIVISGAALIRMPVISGPTECTRVGQGSAVKSGYRLLGGRLEVKPTEGFEDSFVQQLESILSETAFHLHSNEQLVSESRQRADKSVLPNIALAGVAVARGGLGMASGVLHQDWITSTGIISPSQYFFELRLALSKGILINSPTALTRLSAANVLVMDSRVLQRFPSVIEVAGIQVFGRSANAFTDALLPIAHYFGDERFEALLKTQSNTLDQDPSARVLSVTPGEVLIETLDHVVTFKDVKTSSRQEDPDSLQVLIDGALAGQIDFRFGQHSTARSTIQRLKSSGMQCVLLHEGSAEEAKFLAEQNDFDLYHGFTDSEGLGAFFTALTQKKGYRAALFTHSGSLNNIPPEVDVTVGFEASSGDLSAFDFQVLRVSAFQAIPDMIELGKAHSGDLSKANRNIIVPNLLCIAGSFTGVLNGTTSTILAHAGVMAVSSGQKKRLKRTQI